MTDSKHAHEDALAKLRQIEEAKEMGAHVGRFAAEIATYWRSLAQCGMDDDDLVSDLVLDYQQQALSFRWGLAMAHRLARESGDEDA